MNINANMSYREVIPRNLNPEEWVEVEINTGKLGCQMRSELHSFL